MKLIKYLISICLLISMSTLQVYAYVVYKNDIITDGKTEYKKFQVPLYVYNNNIDTLRIVDDEENTVAYFLTNYNTTTLSTIEKNRTYLVDNYRKDNSIFFDFEIYKKNEYLDNKTNILFINANQDIYTKKIKIFGSFDSVEWDYITYEYIYKNEKNAKEYVFFEDTFKYDYYRIEVLDSVDNFKVSELHTGYNETTVKENNYIKSFTPTYYITSTEDTTKIRFPYSEIKNLNISTVTLDIAEEPELFNREVSYGYEYDETEETSYTNNIVRDLPNSFEYTSIEINDIYSNDADMIIEIHDYDDAPLVIDSLTVDVAVGYAVFKADDNKNYKIAYGDQNLSAPRYDIQNYKDDILSKSIDEVTISENNTITTTIEKNSYSLFEKGFTKEMYNIIFVIVSLIVVIILLKNFKNHSK